MPVTLNSLSDYILLVVAFLGAFVSALWLSLIIWTYRDMRARSRDLFAQILAALVVAALTLPGLIIYWILRPPKTLAETYEQSLEEEALLQEIEEKRVCPGCGRQVNEAWVICPNCMTKLKKPCAKCGQLMDLPWNVCPFCTTPVEGMRSSDGAEPAAVSESSASAA
jgi:RNA polymerase subunit RPABC4/transcription elongation factor Spt4